LAQLQATILFDPPSEHYSMSKINIEFTLFSAFYSPLISTMTGGFLKKKGWISNIQFPHRA
jgi:hypothetical protein